VTTRSVSEVTDIGAGVPVVLVNGNYQERSSWRPFAAELASLFRVVTFDFPSQGKAPSVEEFSSVAHYAEYTTQILQQVGIKSEDAVMIGMSAGASIVRYLACEGGHRFKTQFMFGMSPGGLPDYYRQLYGSFIDCLRGSGVAAFSRQTMFLNFSGPFFNGMPLLAEGLIAAFERMYRGREVELEALLMLALDDEVCDPRPGRFRSPAYFGRGEDDGTIPRASLTDYVARCTGELLECVEIAGGHTFCLEQPELTAAFVRARLQALG